MSRAAARLSAEGEYSGGGPLLARTRYWSSTSFPQPFKGIPASRGEAQRFPFRRGRVGGLGGLRRRRGLVGDSEASRLPIRVDFHAKAVSSGGFRSSRTARRWQTLIGHSVYGDSAVAFGPTTTVAALPRLASIGYNSAASRGKGTPPRSATNPGRTPCRQAVRRTRLKSGERSRGS